MEGRYESLEISERAEGYESVWKRVPIGPCSFISPFNFPLNLAAHKMAPAIAVGCSWVLKPASRTPISALIVGEILAETDLPKGAFSILPCSRDGADLFTTDDRFKLLSFTGSPSVGWDLKARAGKKPVVLELGGNAACIVDQDADIEYATERMIHGAFYQSGQSCIGVQRILVHDDIYDAFVERFVEEFQGRPYGDPRDPDTQVGPQARIELRDELHEQVQRSIEAGARLVTGGRIPERDGAWYPPTILVDVPQDSPASREELFGPVAAIIRARDQEHAIELANDSTFGLGAAVFTRDVERGRHIAEVELEAGCCFVNAFVRSDPRLPFGGIKESGYGRELGRHGMHAFVNAKTVYVG